MTEEFHHKDNKGRIKYKGNNKIRMDLYFN